MTIQCHIFADSVKVLYDFFENNAEFFSFLSFNIDCYFITHFYANVSSKHLVPGKLYICWKISLAVIESSFVFIKADII